MSRPDRWTAANRLADLRRAKKEQPVPTPAPASSHAQDWHDDNQTCCYHLGQTGPFCCICDYERPCAWATEQITRWADTNELDA